MDIAPKLVKLQRQLLDLTRRNRLLNHKPTSKQNIQVVDELADQVFKILVDDTRTMDFLSVEEAPPDVDPSVVRAPGVAPLTPTPLPQGGEAIDLAPMDLTPMDEETGLAKRHVDKRLQTALDGKQLQRRLLNLHRVARSALEEQGTNVLFLTLGLVEFTARDDSTLTYRAPLLFVPVELVRRSVKTRHRIRALDEDITTNLCLVELCRRDLGFNLPLFDDSDDQPISEYLAQVKTECPSDWVVHDEMHVGAFSFSKIVMYQDYDAESWPEGEDFASHPLTRRLCGMTSEGDLGPPIPDPNTLDHTVQPHDCFQVLDADSSQQAAIQAAKAGSSLVIDGPPGTGKSQTIANIIAECLAANRSVLFVAEKAAALEVVQRRLTNVGLGDAVLELHSHKISKRAVLEELRRVLEYAPLKETHSFDEADELGRLRAELAAYRDDLHTSTGALGISPYEAIGRATSLASAPEAPVSLAKASDWDRDRLAQATEAIAGLDRCLGRTGEPSVHPWKGVGLATAGLAARQQIERLAEQLTQTLGALTQAGDQVAALLGSARQSTTEEIRVLADLAHSIEQAPRIPRSCLEDPAWDEDRAGLQGWLESGSKRHDLKGTWEQYVKPDAEDNDWSETLTRRQQHGESWLRFLRPSWYADNRLMRSWLVQPALPPLAEQIRFLTALVRSAKQKVAWQAGATRYSPLFSPVWQGINTDCEELRLWQEAAQEIRGLVDQAGADPGLVAELVSAADRTDLASQTQRLVTALEQQAKEWISWLAAIEADERSWLGKSLDKVPVADLVERHRPLPKQIEQIHDWIDYRATLNDCRQLGLNPFLDWALTAEGRTAWGQLESAFNRQFYRIWADGALSSRPALRRFRGEDHADLLDRFRQLDVSWIEKSRRRLITELQNRRPSVGFDAQRGGKLGIVQAEMRKKRRHMPLRKLIRLAGEVIQDIKPVFMMSPSSVAQFLEPGSVTFDVVVFDEASQVPPEDAFGAIARGRQLILVGDEKQLPPTSFFTKVDTGEPSEDDDDGISGADLESILALGATASFHRDTLRWHYRSRHQSLIQFSNDKFYEGALRIFTSPVKDRSKLGLTLQHVADGIYHRGRGHHNPIEAKRVASAVVDHATSHPNLSLGVGAFSVAQQRAIEDEMEQLRRESDDPTLERFFNAHPHEPFFIKNLETIQGDERDVILLSVGYGRDDNGRMYMNFGPLNRDGGWRRLNVLVTRARARCIVYSSILADDINLGATTARGVVALKDYLHLAEHGRLASSSVPSGHHDSPFEAAVQQAIMDRGWEVHSQIGAAGFSIDLAVVDPDRPGRYLMGIECDGASYHSRPTVRDRDRLRQGVLESMGWRIHRVWSPDWYMRPDTTLEHILEVLDKAKRDGPPKPRWEQDTTPPPPPAPTPQTSTTTVRPVPSHDGLVRPYTRTPDKHLGDQSDLLARQPSQIAKLIHEIVQHESPIHRKEAARRLTDWFSTRSSKRSLVAFNTGLQASIDQKLVREHRDFLFDPDVSKVVVRTRDNDEAVTDATLIAPAEYAAAIQFCIEREYGLTHDGLVQATVRLLGFDRGGNRLRSAVEEVLAILLAGGIVELDTTDHIVLTGK